MVFRRFSQTGTRGLNGISSLTLGQLDSVTRGWILVTGGSVARLGLGFIASIIIARALGPAAFGVYSVLAVVSSLTGAAIDLGLTNAAVRRVSAHWPHELIRTAEIWRAFFWLRIVVVSVVVTIGLILADPISSLFLETSERAWYLRLALLGVGATALSGSVTSMLQATGRFGRLSTVLIVNSALTVVLGVGLALADALTITTALLVLGVGTSVASVLLAYRLLPGRWTLRPPAYSEFTRHAGDLTRFGSWLWLGSVFSILALYLDVLIVNQWAVPASVGVYALAVNLAVKADVVNQSLYTVLLPAASALRSRSEVRGYIRRGLLRSAAISATIVPFIVLARPLITLFYGPDYAPAASLLRGLLIVAIMQIVLTPLLMLAFTYDNPKMIALSDGIRALVLLTVALALVPLVGTTGAIVAKLAAGIAGGIIILVFVTRRLRHADKLPVDPDQSPN